MTRKWAVFLQLRMAWKLSTGFTAKKEGYGVVVERQWFTNYQIVTAET